MHSVSQKYVMFLYLTYLFPVIKVFRTSDFEVVWIKDLWSD